MEAPRREDAPVVVGRRVRLIREQLNISQEQLAGLLGVSQATMSKYEAGTLDLGLQKLVKLAEVLHVKVPVLVRGVESSP